MTFVTVVCSVVEIVQYCLHSSANAHCCHIPSLIKTLSLDWGS